MTQFRPDFIGKYINSGFGPIPLTAVFGMRARIDAVGTVLASDWLGGIQGGCFVRVIQRKVDVMRLGNLIFGTLLGFLIAPLLLAMIAI